MIKLRITTRGVIAPNVIRQVSDRSSCSVSLNTTNAYSNPSNTTKETNTLTIVPNSGVTDPDMCFRRKLKKIIKSPTDQFTYIRVNKRENGEYWQASYFVIYLERFTFFFEALAFPLKSRHSIIQYSKFTFDLYPSSLTRQ